MTIIAAVRRDGHTLIGCDTMASWGDRTTRLPTKLDEVGGAVVGASGVPMLSRAARDFGGDVATLEDVEALADHVIEFCKEHNAADEDGDLPGNLLVVTPDGRIWVASARGEVVEAEEYSAIGSGAAVALGAFHALSDTDDLTATGVLRRVLLAACTHGEGCGAPIVIAEVVPPPALEAVA